MEPEPRACLESADEGQRTEFGSDPAGLLVRLDLLTCSELELQQFSALTVDLLLVLQDCFLKLRQDLLRGGGQFLSDQMSERTEPRHSPSACSPSSAGTGPAAALLPGLCGHLIYEDSALYRHLLVRSENAAGPHIRGIQKKTDCNGKKLETERNIVNLHILACCFSASSLLYGRVLYSIILSCFS